MGIKQLIFVVYILIIVSSLNNAEKSNDTDYNMKIFKEYVQIDSTLRDIADRGVKLALPYLMEARDNVQISATCTRNLFQLLSGLRKLSEWSFKFLDASGKPQSGVMSGNVFMFGEYGECIETSVFKKDGKLDFQGQYCSVKYGLHLPKVKKIPSYFSKIDGLEDATRNVSDVLKMMFSRVQIFYGASPRIGLCVPSGCNQQDVTNMVNYLTEMFYMNATVEYCLKEGDIYFWTKTRIAIVCIFVLLGILTLTSTLLDNFSSNFTSKDLSIASRSLMSFSLTRNFPKLMSTKTSVESLASLHAIRTLGILWVLLSHEYIMHAFLMRPNHALFFEESFPSFFPQIIFNGFLVVDTFFFLSGFLNAYIRTNMKLKGEKQPGVLIILIHRIWRLYPTLIVGHFMHYLLHKPGPFSYATIEEDSRKCDLNWWRNFLFINNIYDGENTCLQQTWFISVDTQMFLLSLFTVPVLLRSPKKGVLLNLCMIIIGCVGSMICWWIKEIPPHVDFTLITLRRVNETLRAYVYPFQHFGPYFIGILMGYMISTKKDIKISKIHQILGWLASSFFFISMLFITMRWNAGKSYTMLESILYGAFSRIIFTLGFAWLVLCCVTGHGGVINYILSLKLWHTPSKLSFMMFMVSPLIQIFYHSNLQFPFDATNMVIIWTYFGNMSISLLLSLVLVVTVESPVIALEKIFFRRPEADIKSSEQNQNEIGSYTKKENGFIDNDKYVTTHI